MTLRDAPIASPPVRSSRLHCLLCNYDITGAPIGGTCPECGEPIMRSFEWPHDDGIQLPVSCARCGHTLEREPIDSGCAACGYAVLKTLRGPRRTNTSNPVYAPLALMAGLLTIPCFLFIGFGVIVLSAIAIALLIPAYWEYRDQTASRGAFIAAVVGAAVGVVWLLLLLYLLLTKQLA